MGKQRADSRPTANTIYPNIWRLHPLAPSPPNVDLDTHIYMRKNSGIISYKMPTSYYCTGTRHLLAGGLDKMSLLYTRWLTNSCQLVISCIGIIVSCGGANYPAIFHFWLSLLVGRLAWYGVRIFWRLQEVQPRLRAHREVFCNPWRINPSPSTAPVPMVAGSKVPEALSLAYFSYLFVLFYWWSATACRTNVYVFAVTIKRNTSKRPPNGNGMSMFLVHPYKV